MSMDNAEDNELEAQLKMLENKAKKLSEQNQINELKTCLEHYKTLCFSSRNIRKNVLCKQAKLYKQLGFIFDDQLKYMLAIEMFMEEYKVRKEKIELYGEINQEISDRLYFAKCCYNLGAAYEHVGDISNAFMYIYEGMEQFQKYFTFFDLDNEDIDGNKMNEMLSTALYKAKFANRIANFFHVQEPKNFKAQIYYYNIVLSTEKEYQHAIRINREFGIKNNDFNNEMVKFVCIRTELSEALNQLGILYSNNSFIQRAENECRDNISTIKNFIARKYTKEEKQIFSKTIEKIILCMCKDYKRIGDMVVSMGQPIYLAQHYYEIAIEYLRMFKVKKSNMILFMAELFFEFEQKFKDYKYRIELEMIVRQYPYVSELRQIAEKM